MSQVLARVLSAYEMERCEQLALARALDRMPDLVYCPRCEGPTIEDDQHCAQCSKCALNLGQNPQALPCLPVPVNCPFCEGLHKGFKGEDGQHTVPRAKCALNSIYCNIRYCMRDVVCCLCSSIAEDPGPRLEGHSFHLGACCPIVRC